MSGPHVGARFDVRINPERPIRVGRKESANDVALPRDEMISGTHCSLQFDPDGIILRDLASRNGVYLRGFRVHEARIGRGAVFRAGNSELRVAAGDETDPPLSASDHFGELYGWSPVMRAVFAELERLAAVPGAACPLLVTGATGTGKGLVARGLHAVSSRARGPFVVLDCATLPETLAEAIVCGFNRGAFTGATRDQPSVFEVADGGTLFIDEIGELPLELQSKLLRVLDYGEVARLDSPAHVRKVDVRVISATNRDLPRMMAARLFREDLYYRVLGREIALPPLCDREDDVVLLAERFVATRCARLDVPRKSLTPAAVAALRTAHWPGNVRQLTRVIDCAVDVTAGSVIDAHDLRLPPSQTRAPAVTPSRLPWNDALNAFQAAYLRDLIDRVGSVRGWINRAAAQAGMDRSGLVKALKRLGLYRKDVDT